MDDARYFFNSGGQIRFSGSRSGGAATPQNTNWTTLLSNMGTVTFDWDVTTAAGTNWTGSGIGYYDLTAGFQQLAQGVGTGAYAANDATIFGRTVDGPTGGNGDNGRTLEFRVEYNDDHSNVFSDSVTGTITSVIDYRIADVHLTIDTPVPTAPFIELTAGT